MKPVHRAATLLIGAGVLLLGGCVQRGSDGLPVVTEMANPEDVSRTLSPVDRRWSGEERALDLNLLRTTQRDVARLPEGTRARATAGVWSDAAMGGYLADPQNPWLEQALANAQKLVEKPDEARADPVAALLQWGAWVEADRGFLVALPIYHRAESMIEAGRERATPVAVDSAGVGYVNSDLAAAEERLAELYRSRPEVWADSFAFARATAWLRFAIDQASRQDRSGVVGDALAEFDQIVTSLGNGRGLRSALLAPASRQDRFVPADEPLREDLWLISKRRVTQLRGDYLSYDPIAAELARLDVVLFQATHEYNQRGLPAARPYLLEAEAIAAQVTASPTSQP